MPLPKPNQGESQDEFISRCMANDTMNSEYPDQKQRAGVCYTQWRDKEYTEFKEQQTYDVNNVEIFSTGKWNGDSYTEKDLDDIVLAYQELQGDMKPYLKLGHDDKQQLLQKDGLPSAGWIVNLKRKGQKLLADFKGIPKKIKELIEKTAYGRFSSEIYWDLKIDNKKYRRVLKAVALLGADTPAVQNLDDFINLYTENKLEYEKLKIHDKKEESDMSEEMIKTLQEDIKTYKENERTFEADIKTYKEENEKLVKTNKELEGTVKELTQKIETTEAEQKEKDIKLFIDKAVEEKKILPSQTEKYTKLAMNDFESVQEIVKNNPELVDTEEESQHIEKPKTKKYSEMTDEEKDEYKVEKANEYMKENKVEFKDALTAIEQQLGE